MLNLRASLLRIRDTGRPDSMALQRYDILVPHDGFAVRYWSPVNVPVLDAAGRVEFILHQVLDVTDYVREREQGRLARARGEDWRRRMEAAEADLFARAHELQRLNAELLEARDQLRRRALHDSLTGLVVREVFLEELTRALQRQARHHRPLAVLFIDLDRLKHVNDSYGHHAGDALIRCCAQRLRDCLRPADPLARIGGDEFVALLEDLHNTAEAGAVAQRVLDALNEPCALPGGVQEPPTASIGIAVSTATAEPLLGSGPGSAGPGADAAEELIAHADAAMYRAKQAGRGRYELFDRAAYDALQARHLLENELRAALPAGQVRVHYQPIIDLTNGATYAVEALLRWQHPTRGLLPAGVFIDVAEESGLILELGHWTLTQACGQLAAWRTHPASGTPQRVFVNVSTSEVAQTRLSERIDQAVTAAGVPSSSVVLELTETGILTLADIATGAPLEAVRRLGVELAIDDFGTGHSSVSRLVHLPTRILKIDKSFVRGVAHDRRAAAVVSAVLLLAHNLGKTVIAEGVEDEETLRALHELGCTYAQGYHLGRPEPPAMLNRGTTGAEAPG